MNTPNVMNVSHCQGQLQYTNLYFIEIKSLHPQDGSECASSERLSLEDRHSMDGKLPLCTKITNLIYCVLDMQCDPTLREMDKEQP